MRAHVAAGTVYLQSLKNKVDVFYLLIRATKNHLHPPGSGKDFENNAIINIAIIQNLVLVRFHSRELVVLYWIPLWGS